MTNNLHATFEHKPMTVRDITGTRFNKTKTAFWGKVGYDEGINLYLVNWSGVSRADAPNMTWSEVTDIEVKKWVDIVITVKE